MEKILKDHKLLGFVQKYRYVALVLAVGVVLMLIPTGSKPTKETALPTTQDRILSVEEKLTQILRQVKGAGEVQVLLTEAMGEETIYQTNEDISQNDTSSSSRGDTVTITDSQRNEQGLVRQQNPPQYMGAIVVCQGGDQPTVRLAILDAVSKVTGLGADKISILKMK
jgi:stage III sporulation protein AG